MVHALAFSHMLHTRIILGGVLWVITSKPSNNREANRPPFAGPMLVLAIDGPVACWSYLCCP